METINERKLKYKHYLRVYNLLENYPKEEDILFELASNVNILNGDLFDNKDVQDLLITKIKLTEIDKALLKLEKQNYIKLIEIINSNKNYKLLKHDW